MLYSFLQRGVWRDSRPPSMHQRGRPVEKHFEDDELVFFRWFSNHFEGRELRPANMTTPDQSMNRSGFRGRCWHALISDPDADEENARRWLCMGVVTAASQVFSVATVQNGVTFEFRVEHDLLEHNYCHCELRVHRDGERLPKSQADDLKLAEKKTWKAAQKWFRTEMGKAVRKRKIRILLRSEVGTRGS